MILVLVLAAGSLLAVRPCPVRAALADDAARCLDEEARLAQTRGDLLRQADSLGLRMEEQRRRSDRVPQDLLRRAARIVRSAQDLELELALRRAECREEVARALPECDRNIARLETLLATGQADPARREELLRLRALRSRLQIWLAGPILLGFPLIPPDSTDTPESLAEKLHYHEEVADSLRRLGSRVQARREAVAEERRSLVEAGRFLRDLGFLDEGGRVSPSGSARLGGSPGDNGAPDTMRRVFGTAAPAGGESDLGRVLAESPATPEDSDRVLRLLDGYRQAIERELGSVNRAADEIRRRLGETQHGRR